MESQRAEYLVQTYADAILRIGHTWLGDMDDAKDICQTVLIGLLEDGRTFPDVGQERAWVVRCTINACKNWKKSAWFRRRAPLRRLAALAACVCLVLGLMNYPAIAAGAERVFRYILGVGAAETSASLLVQGEGISHGDGDFLYLIDGAYQRDGVLTVPLDVVSREESPDREAAMRYRLTVYDAEGERLPQVYRWDGELREFRGAETVRFQPLDAYSNWLAWTWLPQGYAGAASNCFLMGKEGSAGGPYTFDVDLYITGRGWQRTVWKGGTLELDTPQAVEATEASRTFAEGTVTALVGADGRSVSFYGELTPNWPPGGRNSSSWSSLRCGLWTRRATAGRAICSTGPCRRDTGRSSGWRSRRRGRSWPSR